ncbi:hypothetical protein OAE88_00715 [bacterium]|nr:hypothetical protein [bacterium]
MKGIYSVDDIVKKIEDEIEFSVDDLEKSEWHRAHLSGQIYILEWIKSLIEEGNK